MSESENDAFGEVSTMEIQHANAMPRAFVVHVNVRENGKVIGWLSTDAIEEEIAFNKDRFSAFEYPTRDEAEKAVGVITLELGIFDAEVMGIF